MGKMSFIAACNKFFGRQPGQDLAGFGAELKTISKKDREELAEMLGKALGVEIEGA